MVASIVLRSLPHIMLDVYTVYDRYPLLYFHVCALTTLAWPITLSTQDTGWTVSCWCPFAGNNGDD